MTVTRVLFVEFSSDGRPFAIVTTAGNYDVEYCRASDEYLARDGGSAGYGSGKKWWAHADFTLPPQRQGQYGKRLKRLPKPWTLTRLLEITENACSGILYCWICKDWYDGTWKAWVCDHVWFCEAFEDCNQWTGPGSDDPCIHGHFGFEMFSIGGYMNQYKTLPFWHHPPRTGPSYSGKLS